MKRHIAWLTILGALAFVAPATAQTAGTETINTKLVFPRDQLPNTAPYVGTFSGGTFSASGTVTDTGTVSGQALLGAAPSPVAGVLQTVRTYSSSGGNGTLMLRCSERFSPPAQFVNLAGTCVVLDATGAYAGVRGSGTLTGTSTFSASAITNQETLTLGEH